ncbi:MAG: AsnC family transcriptional regulator [Paracoccaceae bacterium]
MFDRLDPLDRRLLDEFQRDLPLVPRPFAEIAATLCIDEAETIVRLEALKARGTIARVGATVRPNTAGASTLAAMAAPSDRVDEVAAIVGAEEGVNHSYLREDEVNLWFVVTAPDAASLTASLERIEARTGFRVLDLRLVRPFNIDLGFRLGSGDRRKTSEARTAQSAILQAGDREILQALSSGLPLVQRPFAALASSLARTEEAVLSRIATLDKAGILTRIGVIVRHRAIGWSANAMVVWNLPESRIDAAGPRLARQPGVTLCYQRRTVPGVWDFSLYSMIHARSRAEALAYLDKAAALPELAGVDHRALFSVRCFKQTGALLKATAA